MGRRDPRRVSDALEKVRLLFEPSTRLAEVQGVWDGVVGETVAERCRPEYENGGVVVVHCLSSVWAQEMSAMEIQVRKRLNERLNESWLRKIKFRVVGS